MRLLNMCHLNILLQKKNTNQKIGFLSSVTANSYTSNNDGDGLNFKSVVKKSMSKINLFKYATDILNENNILSHQRIATSGFKKKFLQPFISEDFVLIHNGVVSTYAKNNKSDTFCLFKAFNKAFLECNTKEREENIINTIKKIFDDLNGSFSVCIKDIKTDKIYYFKNDSSSINTYQSKNSLYLTTSYDNKIFLNMLGEHFKNIELEDYKIYSLSVEKLKILGDFKPQKVISYEYEEKYNRCYTTMNDIKLSDYENDCLLSPKKERTPQEEKYFDDNILEYVGELKTDVTGVCYDCKKKTIYFNTLYNSHMCLNCYDMALENLEQYFTENPKMLLESKK